MLYRELINKCDEDTKNIIKKYLVFCHEYSIHYNNDIHRDTYEILNIIYKDDLAIGYLLYIAILYDKDLANILNKNKDIKMPDLILEIISTLDVYYSLDNLECAMLQESDAAAILNAYINLNGSISIERIILNMVNELSLNNRIIKYFNINEETIKEIEKLAQKKENSSTFKRKESNITLPFGENLTEKEYAYKPLIGREKEFRRMCAFLMDEEKSLIIHGKQGVGKTTLINGLAYDIQNNLAPKALKNKKIVEVSSSEIISGCQYVGMVEERVLKLINSLLGQNVILFIDEFHTLMGLGQGSKDNNDVANILKPYLGDGRIKIVGATTTEEYNTILENGAFARRFNGLEIPVLDDKSVLIILKNLIKRYKETRNIGFKYSLETEQKLLELIIYYTNKQHQNYFYTKKLYNPDFALTILRNGYDFALLDGKEQLDIEALIEGFGSMDFISETYVDDFKKEAKAIVREKDNKPIIREIKLNKN